MKKTVLFFSMFAALPAMAETKADSKKAAEDPNRVICRTERSTGSRLATQKRCLTAQQWADQKLIDRQVVERAQGGGWKNGGQ